MHAQTYRFADGAIRAIKYLFVYPFSICAPTFFTYISNGGARTVDCTVVMTVALRLRDALVFLHIHNVTGWTNAALEAIVNLQRKLCFTSRLAVWKITSIHRYDSTSSRLSRRHTQIIHRKKNTNKTTENTKIRHVLY